MPDRTRPAAHRPYGGASQDYRVVYLGDLSRVAEFLGSRPGIRLAAWIGEKGDFAGGTEKASRRCGAPAFEVSGAAELEELLRRQAPLDLGIVANFGIILTRGCLETARKGFVNAHLGLLPENPGRHPVRNAVARKDKIAGVTLHRMTEKVDDGPVLERRTVAAGSVSAPELFERLQAMVPPILGDRLPELLK